MLKTNRNRFSVENPKLGKYAGRMVADVKVGEINLADYLLQSGLAKPYNGGQKPSWDKSIKTARQTSKVTRQHVGQARQESTSSESVYITGKGKKYHRNGCRYLKRDIKMLTPQKAEKMGIRLAPFATRNELLCRWLSCGVKSRITDGKLS